MNAQFPADCVEAFLLSGIDEDKRHSFLSSACGAAAAVGVHFHLFGKLVMDHEGKAFDIDAPGGDVGGDEKLGAFFFEGAHDLVAFRLGQIALEDIDGKAALHELLAEDAAAVFGAAKNEATLFALAFEEVADEVGFVFFDADRIAVVDIAIDHASGVNFHRLRFRSHAAFDELFEDRRKSGGEQPSRLAVGGEFDGATDLLFESHAEHFVRFIEDEILHVIDRKSLALEEIEEAAGSGDDNLRGSLQSGYLKVDFVSASDYFHECFFVGVLGEFEKSLPDLLGELAGRGKDEGLNVFLIPGDFGEERESKGGGFSGAGLSLSDEVVSLLQKVWNGLGLHRGGLVNTHFIQTLDEVGGDAK